MNYFVKPFSFILAGLLILPLFFACSGSDDEEIRTLTLSVAEDETGWLTTADVDFEFEILDGNGGYMATVSENDGDKDADVSIEGNRVIVRILVGNGSGAAVTITDSKNQEATVRIRSTHESLHISTYTWYMDEGQTGTMDIAFGAGAPYTLEKIRGNSIDARIENDRIKATSLGIGDTYYKVRDRRGSVARLTIQTTLDFQMDLANDFLEFDGVNNLSASVKLLWGTGWEIVGSTDRVIERVSVGRVQVSTGVWSDYHVLFIHTANEGKGTDTVTLRNREGDLAVVRLRVI